MQVAALARAHRWLAAVRDGQDIARLARDAGISMGCLRGLPPRCFPAGAKKFPAPFTRKFGLGAIENTEIIRAPEARIRA